MNLMKIVLLLEIWKQQHKKNFINNIVEYLKNKNMN